MLQVTRGALLTMRNSMGDFQLTDSPVGFILVSTFWAQSHVDAVSETRIKKESE
jgi:hypothetical protein